MSWWRSRFTGVFSRFAPVPLRAHDPDVFVHAGEVPPWGGRATPLAAGGAGLDAGSAALACVGEALERLDPRPRPGDRTVVASFDRWPLAEPAVDPAAWVLFHPEQHARPGLPFEPLRRGTELRWVCFRRAGTGEAWWVPEELATLGTRDGAPHRFGPQVSTGLSCGRDPGLALLRGLQEVLERDAVVGAWWGRYALEEHDAERVLRGLDPALGPALRRPNLAWRCFRIASPLCAHATLVTCSGTDREGLVFSAGSAVRETRAQSFEKAFLEAVQGRHYVRWLLGQPAPPDEPPRDFAAHAAYYSRHPERLARTPLAGTTPRDREDDEAGLREDVPALAARLGPGRPVLFRIASPPEVSQAGWLVLRVVVPGTQPLHGDHLLPFLGGPLWAPRGPADWIDVPPHCFP